jgi:hypothetical protein
VEYKNKSELLGDAAVEKDLKTTCEIENINAEGEEFSKISKKIVDYFGNCPKKLHVKIKKLSNFP